MSSSIQGLLEEVQPNFEIMQIIKAADQLYYKDKQCYTDIKPELTSSIGGSKEAQQQENKKPKKEARSENEQNSQQNRAKNISESTEKSVGDAQGQQQGKKPNKKEKKKGKGGAGGNPQQPIPIQQSADGSGATTDSKLQQVIQQAKKTVENALNIGSSGGGGTNGSGGEIVELRKIVDEQQKQLDKLEKITKKLLKSAGLTESDLSD